MLPKDALPREPDKLAAGVPESLPPRYESQNEFASLDLLLLDFPVLRLEERLDRLPRVLSVRLGVSPGQTKRQRAGMRWKRGRVGRFGENGREVGRERKGRMRERGEGGEEEEREGGEGEEEVVRFIDPIVMVATYPDKLEQRLLSLILISALLVVRSFSFSSEVSLFFSG